MQQLNEDLKSGQLKQAYLLYGEEAYLRKQYKDKLQAVLLGEGDAMNSHYFEGKDINPGEVIDLAETMPFFAERRVIVLENSGLFKSGGEKMAEYLTQPAPTAYFVFVESEVDKRSKLYKQVQQLGRAVEFSVQDERTLKRWIAGILKKGVLSSSDIIASRRNKEALDSLHEKYGIDVTADNKEAAKAEIVVLAIKPQFMKEVIDEIKSVVTEEQIILSIAAGKTIAFMENEFGGVRKIVRCMPNTPALVLEGSTGVSHNKNVSDIELKRVLDILLSCGFAAVVDEKLMDAVVVTCSALVFKDIDKALYAGMTVIITSLVMDIVLYGKDEAKLIHIISDKSEEITKRLLDDLEIGVTYVRGEGAYSGKEKKVIMCVVKKQISPKVEDIIKEEDPMAFMIVSSAMEIYGEGYKNLFSEKI